MTILYDHQAFTMQAYGGISRYYAEVISKLQQSRQLSVRISLLSALNENLHRIHMSVARNFPGKKWIDRNYYYREVVNKLNSRLVLSLGNYDLFHPTYYDTYFLNALGRKPFVLTVHDTIHEKFGYRFPALTGNMPSVNDKSTLLHAASGIIAVSANTKADLIDLYAVPASKIDVIPLASPFTEQGGQAERDLQGETYLLYVGNRDAYKNFIFFIRSIAKFLGKNKQVKLVCAGGGNFSEAEAVLIKRLGLERSVIYYAVNDTVLPLLYAGAIAFVFPSLYEGFGIPVLEAMQNQCPCVLSTGGSLPEVAEQAALYFDPENSQSIVCAVEQIVFDAQLRSRLRKAGSRRLQFFSWQRTSELTMQVYKKLC